VELYHYRCKNTLGVWGQSPHEFAKQILYHKNATGWLTFSVEGRFKSSLIDSEHYLLTCYRYIEENLVRAGMIQSIKDYRWSSYQQNALRMIDELVLPTRYLMLWLR